MQMLKEIWNLLLFGCFLIVAMLLFVVLTNPSVETMVYLKWFYVILITTYVMWPTLKKDEKN
jgi:hypothetical protein